MEPSVAQKTQSAEKRSRGRPPKLPADRKRSVIALRVRDGMKAALAARAAASQRSISEVAEGLLEAAMQSEGMLFQALDLAVGRRGAGTILLLTKVLSVVGPDAAR